MIRLFRLSRVVRPAIQGCVVAIFALGAACSSTDGDSSSNGQAADVPFEGIWHAAPDGQQSFDVNVESDKATVVRFGPGFQIGNPEVINGGDLFLKGLTRVDSQTFRGDVADIVFAHSPTAPKHWPASMKYVAVTITWDESNSKWTVNSPKIEFSDWGHYSFDGKYYPAGACEQMFVNHNNVTLYMCQYPQDDDGCSSAGEKAFWPSTDCEHLGYMAVSQDALAAGAWQYSDTSNVTPGEHGKWGDGTGGGKIVSAAATAAGSSTSDGGVGGGDGAACLVGGTWGRSACDTNTDRNTLTFTGDAGSGSGTYKMPDCADPQVCVDPIQFDYTYTVTGSSVTLYYTKSHQIDCGALGLQTPAMPTVDDTFEFTCSGNTLTTTVGSTTYTYTR